MRLIVLGLIILHPAPSESAHILTVEFCYRATLIVCASMRKEAWLSVGAGVDKPFSFLEYSDTDQFWTSINQ